MKAIIFKEIRENLPWAALIFVITGGLLVLGICEEFRSGLPLIEKTTLTACMLMYPVAGLGLGLVQILLDFRRGRWQFVSHRPISRSKFFIAKALVGILLYAVATLIPFSAAVGWVATPGHIAGPFSWDMTFPALAYLCSGLMWYALGLLLAARNARWFGSRLMPVGVALAGMVGFIAFANTFVVALVVLFICTTILLVAAWGAFVSGGESRRIPVWSRPFVGVGVVVGWSIAIGSVMGMATEAIKSLAEPRGPYIYKMYRLGPEGELQTVTYGNDATEPIEDLSGKVVGDYMVNRASLAETTLDVQDPDEHSTLTHARTEWFMRPESHANWIASTAYEEWCYVASRHTIEGFNRETRRFVGSFGPEGFSAPGKSPAPFDKDGSMKLIRQALEQPLLVLRNQVFYVDIPDRRVTMIFSSAENDPVLAADSLQARDDRGLPERGGIIDTVIATRSTIHIIRNDRQLMTIPLLKNDDRTNVAVGRTGSGKIVVGYGVNWPAGFDPVDVRIYDTDGKLVDQTKVPGKAEPPGSNPRPLVREVGITIPVPPIFLAVLYTLNRWQHLWAGWRSALTLLATAGFYGIIAFAMLRARHASRGRLILWLIIVACLGLSGIFLLMSVWEKPRSIKCASCGKRRLITEDRCINCLTAAEGPAMLGIEIFGSRMMPVV